MYLKIVFNLLRLYHTSQELFCYLMTQLKSEI